MEIFISMETRTRMKLHNHFGDNIFMLLIFHQLYMQMLINILTETA